MFFGRIFGCFIFFGKRLFFCPSTLDFIIILLYNESSQARYATVQNLMQMTGELKMYYLGIDLGGTNIAAGIVDENSKILIKGSVPTLSNRDGRLIIKDMAELCKRLINDMGITVDDIEYAGIATPGTANSETGIVEYANNLPFVNFPIADLLKEYLGVKRVYIENDANAAAKAEAVAGAAKGAKYSVMITLGTGLGGGIVIDGKVYSGFNHAGGELGHVVIQKDGKQCSCGRKGCWEAYSSATGLVNMTKERLIEAREKGVKSLIDEMIGGDLNKVNARVAFAAMKQGDELGAKIVDEYISYLASGVATMINIFQPNVLSIGGGVCNEKDYLLVPLKEKVFAETYSKDPSKQTQIKIAELGNDAGIVGAASLGL